jgi:hypothetical protein
MRGLAQVFPVVVVRSFAGVEAFAGYVRTRENVAVASEARRTQRRFAKERWDVRFESHQAARS